jgi:hypothetical protein
LAFLLAGVSPEGEFLQGEFLEGEFLEGVFLEGVALQILPAASRTPGSGKARRFPQ